MMKISFELNGRKINPNQIGKEIEKAVFENVQKSIIKSVGSIHCKTHGKTPSIKVKGRSVEKLNFDVSGCCEDIIDQVRKKLDSKN